MNKRTLLSGSSIVLASLAFSTGAMAAGLPALPAASIGHSGIALPGITSAPATITLPAAPSVAVMAIPASGSAMALSTANATLPGLDGLSSHTEAYAPKTNAIRPIRLPGGGRVNLPITLPIPGVPSGS